MQNEIFKLADALRFKIEQDNFTLLILHETLHQMGDEQITSSALEVWAGLQNTPIKQAPLAAAARSLLQLPPHKRLEELDKLIQAEASKQSNVLYAWINGPAAQQLAGLVQHAETVRCAGAWTLHTALLLAADQTRKAVRFVAPDSNVCALARLLAKCLDCNLDVVETEPNLREQGPKLAAEIILPAFGVSDFAPDDLPRRTLDILGLDRAEARVSREILAIADALAQTDSTAVLIVPNGTLSRMVGVEPVVREALVTSGRLRAVLSAPSGMIFSNTMISTSILVLGAAKQSSDRVLMLDLSGDLFATKTRGRHAARRDLPWNIVLGAPLQFPELAQSGELFEVSVADIIAQDYILTTDRYRQSDSDSQLAAFLEDQDTAPLEDIAELIRPVALPKAEDGDISLHEAAPSDIGERGLVEAPKKEIRIRRAALRKARNQQLQTGDVVISVKGTVGAVGLVPEGVEDEVYGEMWTAGQSLMILRLKTQRLTPVALYEYLSSDSVRAHLQSLAGGATIPMLGIKDLRALRVPLPGKALLDEIDRDFRHRQAQFDKIEQMQAKVSEERASSWPHRHLAVGPEAAS